MKRPILSESFRGQEAGKLLGKRLGHNTELAREEVIRAPFIHLGSVATAKDHQRRALQTMQSDGGPLRHMNVHQFKLAPHSEVHPEIFTDEAVNLAHASLLTERRLAVPPRVFTTAAGARATHFDGPDGLSSRDVEPIKNLLEQNIPVVYKNEHEIGFWGHNDPRSLSVLVPAPHMNLVAPNARNNPHPNLMLPMDYSMGARPTRHTQAQHEEWKQGRERSKRIRVEEGFPPLDHPDQEKTLGYQYGTPGTARDWLMDNW